MGGSTRRKLRSEISRDNYREEADEGTAARTRPLSYDEIMLKRKSKKQLENVGEKMEELESSRHEETVRKSDHHRRDANPISVKNSRDHGQVARSRKKEEKASKVEDTDGKKESRESRDVEIRSKDKHEKGMKNSTETVKNDSRGHGRDKLSEHQHEKRMKNTTETVKNDSRGHGRDKLAEHQHEKGMKNTTETVKNDSRGNGRDKLAEHQNEKGMKNTTERVKNDSRGHGRDKLAEHQHEKGMKNTTETVKSDSRGHGRDKLAEHQHEKAMINTNETVKNDSRCHGRDKLAGHLHEKGMKNTTETVKNDSRGHGRDKLAEHPRDAPKISYEKRNHRDSVAHERHMERSRAPERESKRKDRDRDDEKHRKREPVKKHDSGRRHSEILERKEKIEPSSYSRHDEVRSKRRRSRSPEYVLDKGRSRSPSPKTQKNVPSIGNDHDDLSSHSQKDRSRHHSDFDQKMSSNGSGSHHRRHGGSSSGLGGYSPRKRKTEAAVKTPSPPVRSPEKKSAGWDLPPSRVDRNLGSSVASGPQQLAQTVSSNIIELVGGISIAASVGKSLPAILTNNMSTFKETSIDSIQLTQATRPMRRLYVDNIPASTTEKDIMEGFNSFLLSSGANHIRGTRPCISCMIHKEKGQALVEFLSPEYASAALSFDGRALFGSIVKIRRPKDFVEAASGSSEKSKARVDAISDFVKDSPHKIFIGGIAEGLSSEMVMEIVTGFGPLKAYRFQINEDLNEPCVFLEYADQSITLKACASLNGMKLGGRVLTVAQAVPHISSSSVENSRSIPFYGIPEHVKPLLETPTQVLKLNNVLDQKMIELLSPTDLEEIVEDVRLECSRFGSVVSIKVVKTGNVYTASEPKEVSIDTNSLFSVEERDPWGHHLNGDSMEGALDHEVGGGSGEISGKIEEYEIDRVKEGDALDPVPVSSTGVVEVEAAQTSSVDIVEEDNIIFPRNCDDGASNHSPELSSIVCSTVEETERTDGSNEKREIELCPSEKSDTDMSDDGEIPSVVGMPEFDKTNHHLEKAMSVANDSATTNTGAAENNFKNKGVCENENVFHVGCVLVEFRRSEASSMAAHCLHGRVFDDRMVTVEYVQLDAYRAGFAK